MYGQSIRRLAALALLVGLAVGVSSASGGSAKQLDRCSGKPSWRYVQTMQLTEPNPTATFDPDPIELYKLVFSGYVKDKFGNLQSYLQTEGDAFQVNGIQPPLGRAAQYHRTHPLKDPSAVEVTIQDTNDGKSLAWDDLAWDYLPAIYPGPTPSDKPCTMPAGVAFLPGRVLSITPGPEPAFSGYTGTISMAIYKLVWGSQVPPPEGKVVANAAFSGSNSLEKTTPRPGEVRKWVSVSGFVQLSRNADGQLEAVGGGGEGGVYERPPPTSGSPPTVTVRNWRFRIDETNGPPDRGTLNLEATVVASSQDACPAEGAKIQIILRDGGQNKKLDSVAIRGGCVTDAFSSDRGPVTRSDVTLKELGG